MAGELGRAALPRPALVRHQRKRSEPLPVISYAAGHRDRLIMLVEAKSDPRDRSQCGHDDMWGNVPGLEWLVRSIAAVAIASAANAYHAKLTCIGTVPGRVEMQLGPLASAKQLDKGAPRAADRT